ncbi:MAG: hypothetical protein ACM3QR_00490 [Syntrophothermus sp.]
MDKVYTDLQFAENEFFRAYNLALKMAGSVEGTRARVEKIRNESELEESELYAELQHGIKSAAEQTQIAPQAELDGSTGDRTEIAIEFLRKQYAAKRTAVLGATTIKLRAVALGR